MDKNNLDKKIDKYCAENSISGVLRVTIKNNIVYQKAVGYADFENKIPFDDNSMFTFYSLSKPFCTIGLMKLKEKGLIDLDAHPSKYLPEARRFNSKITIRNLLYHESGIPDFLQEQSFAQKYAPGTHDKLREHLLLISDYPQYFEPGTEFRYTNINFIICALIIENVSGMKYSDYMKREVFMPLGMTTAQIDDENLFVENRVKGYSLIDGMLQPVNKGYDWMLGGGDIIGRVDDVYCLNKAIKNKLLLSEQTWQEILTPSRISEMGMGCMITDWHGKLRISHNGGHIGFRTLHAQVPEDDFDLIFMSNSGFGDARYALGEIVYSEFYGDDGKIEKHLAMDVGYI